MQKKFKSIITENKRKVVVLIVGLLCLVLKEYVKGLVVLVLLLLNNQLVYQKDTKRSREERGAITRSIGITASLVFVLNTVQNLLCAIFTEQSEDINIISGYLALVIFSTCMLMNVGNDFKDKDALDNWVENATLFSVIGYITTNIWITSTYQEECYIGFIILGALLIAISGYAVRCICLIKKQGSMGKSDDL